MRGFLRGMRVTRVHAAQKRALEFEQPFEREACPECFQGGSRHHSDSQMANLVQAAALQTRVAVEAATHIGRLPIDPEAHAARRLDPPARRKVVAGRKRS